MLEQKKRLPRVVDGREPCEWENTDGFKWVWIDSYPPSQIRVPYFICARNSGGFVDDCPYPARLCGPKRELEK